MASKLYEERLLILARVIAATQESAMHFSKHTTEELMIILKGLEAGELTVPE
jgi:hypothetical protein